MKRYMLCFIYYFYQLCSINNCNDNSKKNFSSVLEPHEVTIKIKISISIHIVVADKYNKVTNKKKLKQKNTY